MSPPLLTDSDHLILLGCGRMGSALLQGWIEDGVPASAITVIDPHPTIPEPLRSRIRMFDGIDAWAAADNIHPHGWFILAIKPQMAQDVIPYLAHHIGKHHTCLSIMAGITTKRLRGMGLLSPSLIRVMPNIAALVKQSMSVGFADGKLPTHLRDKTKTLFNAVGRFLWIDREECMDAVTALSGSGPALFYRLVEAMIEAGQYLGLDETLTKTLTEQTFYGSASLLHQTAVHAASLRQQVTSPKGTTQAALDQLLGSAESFDQMILRAMEAATKRGCQLSQ